MKKISLIQVILIIVSLVITSQRVFGSVEKTVAVPSEYAVRIKSEESHYFLKPDNINNNTYTIAKGTTLVFEVDAQILAEKDVGVLSSEWYHSKAPDSGKPILLLGWWWWADGNRNAAAPEQTPSRPNTPDAPPNTGTKGLFVFEQTFEKVTSPDSPSKITAVFYPVKTGKISPPAIVEFLINVEEVAEISQTQTSANSFSGL